MTVSEIIKESKPLCKGFKFKYLCSILLLTIILVASELAFVTVIETTKVYDNGVVNLMEGKPLFQGYENLFNTEFKCAFVSENTVDENGLDPELNGENNATESTSTSTTKSKCLCCEKTASCSQPLSQSPNPLGDYKEVPTTTIAKLTYAGIVYPILSNVLTIGLILIGLERVQNKKFNICSLLKPIKQKWHLLAYHYILITFSILSIGVVGFCGIISAKLSGNQQVGLLVALILALAPIYYFFTHAFFSGILIYTKRMKAINALKTSHKMVTKNLKLCAWYSIVYLFQTLLATLLFIVPLFWILPKFAIAYGILFERLSEKEFPTTETS